MNYRVLGRTNLKVSEIGFGAWGIGGNSYGHADDKESIEALDLAFENGVTFYDTADLYGNGHSEEIIGKTFKQKREKIIIASKGGTLPHTGFKMPQDFSFAYLTNALEKSLKKIRTDYIDLYQLHSPQLEDIEKNNTIDTLEKFKQAGKIKEYGISVRSPQDGLIAIEKYNFPIIQVNYNMIDQRAREINLFEAAKRNQTGLIIRTPLVFGFLTGNLTGKEKFEGQDHRNQWPKEQIERWANAPELFRQLNENKKRTLVQLALQFCLYDHAVSTVIPGMMNVKEVEENTGASNLKNISSEEMEQVYAIYRSNDFYDKKAKVI